MVDSKKTGTVFDIQSLSFHDGPGIRTLVFLKGCPLKCLWCANPEGQKNYVEIRYHSSNCQGCLECARVCTKGAITENRDINGKILINIDKEKCSKCIDLECAEACCNGAITSVGKVMTVAEVMKAIKRDLPYYRGKGGVTLSGGDPTYQVEFAVEILKACHEEYINTAIESAMLVSSEVIDKFLPFTDLFLTDIKHMNSSKHMELTGVGNELILKNIAKIAKYKPVLVRVPVIPSLNDDEENISATAEFCLKNGITRINLLPYHKLGQVKYEQLGLEYNMPDVQLPESNKMEQLKAIVEKIGVTCII